jgi:hypothetical protein
MFTDAYSCQYSVTDISHIPQSCEQLRTEARPLLQSFPFESWENPRAKGELESTGQQGMEGDETWASFSVAHMTTPKYPQSVIRIPDMV